MKTIEDKKVPQFKSFEEEREYWEARGPFGEGHRARLNRPSPGAQRGSFLTVRMSGAEITRLRDVAIKFDCGPSTLARRILIAFIDQMEKLGKMEARKDDRTLTLEEICESVEEKIPAPLKDRLEKLVKAAMLGDRSFILVDPAQMPELEEVSAKLISMLIETAAPSVRVITPYDSNYEKVKSAIETGKGGANRGSRARV
ncbi:MAG: hypothetical protein HYY29_04070 [Chloroflexi bacterium]|nr:hypothetical protein [Chloroflexota bacterium]